jgi:hypothetical protein
MQHSLAGSRIKLTWLQDRRALAEIDWPEVFDDLADAGTPAVHWLWCDLDSLTHVVLATDQDTGNYAGVLGLTRRGTPLEPWLTIGIALARPEAKLPCAMLAHALARIICIDDKPVAIAASPANRETLSDLSCNIRSAILHPPAEGNVIGLRAASLAREIGGGKTVLDLRYASEISLLRDLRGLHNVRSQRRKSNSPESAMERPAKSADATRRPRKATRTGRSG